MGRASTKEHGMSCSYIVGRYKEAGNMGGEYKKNVFKGSFTKDLCNKLDDLIKGMLPDNSHDSDNVNSDDENSGSKGDNGDNIAGSDDNSGSPKAARGNEDSTGSSFNENALQAHNNFRAIHGATDMKIDPTLSEDAELYAKELAKIGYLKHAQLEDIGENLAYGCSSTENYEISAAEATKRW